MPLWDAFIDLTIRGVGPLGVDVSKNIKISVDAPTLGDAITLALKGLVSIRVVRVTIQDPATESLVTPLQVP